MSPLAGRQQTSALPPEPETVMPGLPRRKSRLVAMEQRVIPLEWTPDWKQKVPTEARLAVAIRIRPEAPHA